MRINLQGGDAHGAITLGVLDRMLGDEWVEIAAVGGTSAGAMNAAAGRRRPDLGRGAGRAPVVMPAAAKDEPACR